MKCDYSNESFKISNEQYFPVVLFIITLECVYENSKQIMFKNESCFYTDF